MGNCLRLGISRVGLAWSKWRMAAKYKKKNVSIIILGMQAVGKSTIALRLYKFKRTLPDTNYVQTKGFNTYTVKKRKTTVNIYDLGGHPSIQELWDHYYSDAHGVIFVVDTSQRDTVPEAGQLLAKVLNDNRIRGKPVLLLANKVDLDGISENELDAMLNLQQLVNSVRCLTRLDVSCAIDLKNDAGIFEGFKWLVSHIESNYLDLNTRVLSDTLEEKNREKARREAVKAERLQETLGSESVQCNGTSPLHCAVTSLRTPTPTLRGILSKPGSATSKKSKTSRVYQAEGSPSFSHASANINTPTSGHSMSPAHQSQSAASSAASRISVKRASDEPKPLMKVKSPPSKVPPALLPPICGSTPLFVDQPMKLPRLKSPKSKPEVLNRIEDHDEEANLGGRGILRNNYLPATNNANTGNGPTSANDQQNLDEKGFRFRRISAARRLSPEGADSDDGIVNYAYEPTEDLSSDSTPVGVRRHNFDDTELLNSELHNKEILMVTTLAEVHKEYFKDRKGSTSTHDSVSLSMASMISEGTTDVIDNAQNSHPKQMAPSHQVDEKSSDLPITARKPSLKGKSKKRFNMKNKNKTAPLDPSQSDHSSIPSSAPGTPTTDNGQKISKLAKENTQNDIPAGLPKQQRQNNSNQCSRNASASPKASASGGNGPFTVSNAWNRNTGEFIEMNVVNETQGGVNGQSAGQTDRF